MQRRHVGDAGWMKRRGDDIRCQASQSTSAGLTIFITLLSKDFIRPASGLCHVQEWAVKAQPI